MGADPSFRLCDFTGKRNLTCQTAVTLKHSLHIGLAALERVQIPDENPGIHRLWVLRIGLVAHFAHLHRLEQKNVTGCRFILERDSDTTNATSKSDTLVYSLNPSQPSILTLVLVSISSLSINSFNFCFHTQISKSNEFNYLFRDAKIRFKLKLGENFQHRGWKRRTSRPRWIRLMRFVLANCPKDACCHPRRIN